METIIVTLTLLAFVAGINADCTVSSAIPISGAGQGSCSVSAQTVADNGEAPPSCGVTCRCSGQTLTCCLGSSCTSVGESCSSLQVSNGALSCALKRKRRDILGQLLHRTKRDEEETTTTEDAPVIDGTTAPPTTTTTAATPPVRH